MVPEFDLRILQNQLVMAIDMIGSMATPTGLEPVSHP